jgi:hypothetical protein
MRLQKRNQVPSNDPSLRIRLDPLNPVPFRRVDFITRQCGEWYNRDSSCLFSFSDERDCYLASRLPSESIELVDTEFIRENYVLSVTQNTLKRGVYCSTCTCNEKEMTIDCRGENLTIAPNSFSPSSDTWLPLVIDFRDNPELVFIDDTAFTSIQGDIREIIFPSTLRHPRAV